MGKTISVGQQFIYTVPAGDQIKNGFYIENSFLKWTELLDIDNARLWNIYSTTPENHLPKKIKLFICYS